MQSFVKNAKFCEKCKVLSKMEIFDQNENSCKTGNVSSKFEFSSEIEILNLGYILARVG